MASFSGASAHSFDAIIVGGGHNGLIAAAYLARAGLKVVVLEARTVLGGPSGTWEFMPGYRASFTNSPGSFEPKFVAELELAKFGLRFVRTDPTVVHPFPSQAFIGWRDRERLAVQLDGFAAGEAERYFGLLNELEELGGHLSTSIFAPSPDIATIARHLPEAQSDLFNRVFFGSLTQLLDEKLRSVEAKALLGMVALNTVLTPPSAPGSAIVLMMRPISLSSSPALDPGDPRRAALRGSTGLPVGGMGAIIDALEACCRHHGVEIRRNSRVARVEHRNGRTVGVVTTSGDEFGAAIVVSTLNPKTLFGSLLDDDAVGANLRESISALPMRGSAFKLVLALDGLPDYAGLPRDVSTVQAATVQFRIAPSLDYIETAVADGLRGVTSQGPIMWGLMPSVTSPGMAPAGHHLLSINIWHAPYELSEGSWPEAGEAFANRCIEVICSYMPNLRQRIIGRRTYDPVQLTSELGLVSSNITHGDMLPGALFGARPHRLAHDYRTPLGGLYISGSGTWPGGYVTGVPGFNAATAVLHDLRANT